MPPPLDEKTTQDARKPYDLDAAVIQCTGCRDKVGTILRFMDEQQKRVGNLNANDQDIIHMLLHNTNQSMLSLKLNLHGIIQKPEPIGELQGRDRTLVPPPPPPGPEPETFTRF